MLTRTMWTRELWLKSTVYTNTTVTHSLINSILLVPTALWRRHAQTVGDWVSCYKIDYVIVIKNFLDPEEHQNPISGSTVMAILLKGWILPLVELHQEGSARFLA